MINIAFCDDDPAALRETGELLTQYQQERRVELRCCQYGNPLGLLLDMEQGKRYDVIFLDAIMPEEDGIETAREIRGYDQDVKLIFLTSSSDFAVQSYTVGAYFYQLKPITKDSFFRLLENVLAACEKEQDSCLVLRCKSGITRISLKQLEYCEVMHRTLFVHLTGGTVLESSGRMDELAGELLPHGNFIRPHRSFLVNLEYVHQISYRAITMSSQVEIPIPRGKYNEIKNTFLAYAFESRKVML